MTNPDLFGQSPPQGDLFAGEAPPSPRRVVDFPDAARRKLNMVLAQARAASTLPWSAKETATWEILFRQMSGWLPDDEAGQLRFEFAREIERLRNAA